jgi:hypothetical protein
MMTRPDRKLNLERLEDRLALVADLVISEFMAANSATLADADGDHPDWIEIYNPSSSVVDLGGWRLTDNASNLAKWSFPAQMIAPQGRLVVFASEKDRAVAGGELHTNFKLDGDGEFLALVRPDSTIASEFTPAYPDQIPDVSYGVGVAMTTSTAVASGAPASVHVPTDDGLGSSWTGVGFDDANWNATLARMLPTIVVSEAGPGEPDFVEIQNVSGAAIDTTGWVVAVSASAPGNPSSVNPTLWHLPASIASGQSLYRTDSAADNYFGSDIAWSPGGNGWVMIVDDDGNVVDFAAWGYSQAELALWNQTINGHVIGGDVALPVADYEYDGNPAVAHPISGQYPDATGTLLTDGNLGTSDWRSGYAGSQEPTAQGDTGRFQPRVTFDLGGLHSVRSVTITYMVDQSAGIHAPDSVAVSFGTGGVGGAFGGTITSTGFNNATDSQPATYFGDVRTLTIDLGGATANAVRLDFLNDREWTFLSEVSFKSAGAATNWSGDGAATDPTAGLSLQRIGNSDANDASNFQWLAPSPGGVNSGLAATFPASPIVNGFGYEQATGFGGAFATDLQAAMQGKNASVYVRVPFNVSQPDTYAARLRMKYDGGFIAYLNGVEIARRNAPASTTWNSASTANRSDADALVFTTIDLPLAAPLPLGANVLSIQGLNDSANSSSFLLVPELEIARPTGAGESNVYFSTPTPGAANALGLPGLAAAPEFSQPSGVYSAAFPLSITSADPLAQIRYTLDGTEPTEAAPLYSSPIAVNATTLVKARAFRDAQIASPIRQGSYLRIDAALATRDSDVPLVVIDSLAQAIPSTGSWASSVTALIDTDATGRAQITGTPDFLGRGGLHVRGSSSIVWPKKNLSFETWDSTGSDADVSLFGMPAESDWVLYASYLDRTLLRDSLVDDLGNQMGEYSVRTRPVEVYLNTGGGVIGEDDYLGVYVFVERIKQGDDRVDVAKLDPSDATEPEISGGYVLKIDRGAATVPAALSRDLIPVDPEDADLTTAQRTWITNYVAQFEAALAGPDFADPATGYAKYIDVQSWIDYHIMTELTFNVDEWYLSTYLSKDRGGKLKLGPFWDFDRSLGNTDQLGAAGTTGWYSDALVNFFATYNGQAPSQVVEYPWFRRLFEDPNFATRYADRRTELRRTVLSEANIFATIDRLAAERQESQARNFARWNTLNTLIAPSPLAFPTYEEHVADLKGWIHDRLAWLDGQYVSAPEFTPAGGAVATGVQVSMQIPATATFADTVLIDETSTIRSLVPTSDALGLTWTGGNEPFADATWTSGQNGVGYETDTGFGGYIHVSVPPGTLSSYVRAAFNVADPATVNRLILKMRYDDGFVAYVNGVEVARVNAPATLAYNVGATANHDDAAAVVYQEFDISSLGAAALKAGENILAVRGLNYLTTSTDYLTQFGLVAQTELPGVPQNIPIYYTVDGTDPRVPNTSIVQPLLASGAAARARVPTSDIGATWHNLTGFDDSTWTAGTTGVGFEKSPGDALNYTSLIGLNVQSQIDATPGGANEFKSVYVRVPFTASNVQSIGTLRLKMKYDDGFVAYLNGTKVAEARAPATPLWNSQSTSPNPDAAAVVFEVFDISAFRGLLQNGNNLLAIHGMASGVVDTDMLFIPELESVQTLGGISPSATLYSGPVTIDENRRIIARAFDGTRWSGLTDATFAVSAPRLRVSELHYHPSDPTDAEIAAGFVDADDFEFVELVNAGASTIDLAGIAFNQGIQFTFGAESLAVGERIVVAAKEAAFRLRYGEQARLAGEYGATSDEYRFANGGEQVALVGPLLEPIESFVYDDAWQRATDGEGYSLTAVNPSAADEEIWSQSAGWRASFEVGGSPGEADRMRGDLNGDDHVNLVDLTLLQQHLGMASGASLAEGDVNRDGSVNRADAALLAANFGRFYEPPAAPAAIVAQTTGGRVARALATGRAARRTAHGAATAAVDQLMEEVVSTEGTAALRASRARTVQHPAPHSLTTSRAGH